MAGSGVYRLRLAKRGGGSNPREKNPSSGKKNTVKVDVNVGSDLDVGPNPKSVEAIFRVHPITMPPISNEQPSRGEHGRNTRRNPNSH
jgi:hypothetical protein